MLPAGGAPIIGSVVDETETLVDHIHALLGLNPLDRAAIEDALTDGYARALALEAENRRLERRIVELAGSLTVAGDRSVSELSDLSGRRTRALGELARLRDLLSDLRGHLATAGATQPSSAA
jgi:GAF domain-containing protein